MLEKLGFKSKKHAALYMGAMVANGVLWSIAGIPMACIAIAGAYVADDVAEAVVQFRHARHQM